MKNSRRDFLKKGASLAAFSTAALTLKGCSSEEETRSANSVEWPVSERRDTPKMCIWTSRNADRADMRKIKQLGVDVVAMGGPSLPWQAAELRRSIEQFDEGELEVINMMLPGQSPARIATAAEEDVDGLIEQVQESIREAGAAGLPIVEYNWYAQRLMGGYYEVEGRGGAGYTGFDYEPVNDLPPPSNVGTHSSEALWDRLTRFLEAVIPVAEEAGVRLALHPNDPPVPVSHGSEQIMRTLDDWKRLISIVDSPSNGITFDCGVTGEIGEDAVEVCRYFASRDRINHMHYRNVLVEEPYVKYVEVFPDNGTVDMFGVMRELVRHDYPYGIWPEHERALDYDREQPGGITGFYSDVGGGGYAGLAYNIAYTRGMLQAAMITEGKA